MQPPSQFSLWLFPAGLQYAGALEGYQTRRAEQHQELQRGLGVFVLVDLFDFFLVTHHLSGIQARSMQVEPAVEHLLIERIETCRAVTSRGKRNIRGVKKRTRNYGRENEEMP